jgi:hypothetical protein
MWSTRMLLCSRDQRDRSKGQTQAQEVPGTSDSGLHLLVRVCHRLSQTGDVCSWSFTTIQSSCRSRMHTLARIEVAGREHRRTDRTRLAHSRIPNSTDFRYVVPTSRHRSSIRPDHDDAVPLSLQRFCARWLCCRGTRGAGKRNSWT